MAEEQCLASSAAHLVPAQSPPINSTSTQALQAAEEGLRKLLQRCDSHPQCVLNSEKLSISLLLEMIQPYMSLSSLPGPRPSTLVHHSPASPVRSCHTLPHTPLTPTWPHVILPSHTDLRLSAD